MSTYANYYQNLADLLQTGMPVWQATVTQTDNSTPARLAMKLAIPLQGKICGNLGGGELEHKVINLVRETQPLKPVRWLFDLKSQHPKGMATRQVQSTDMLCGGSVEVLVEPLHAAHPLYIIGGGHCGRALAEFAVQADFAVTVIDDRADVLQRDAFPASVQLISHAYHALSEVIHFSREAYIVIMTHGHVHDHQVLEACLQQPFRYLGMLGSQTKVKETFTRLQAKGFTEDDIAKVKAPIGLPIGSHTPVEIAISILAQLVQTRNQAQN